MIEKTTGIVLKIFPFKESSSIVEIYTEKWGLKSFIIKGGRKKNAQVKSVIFQPLQVVSIATYVNKRNTLSLIKEAYLNENLDNIYCEMVKTSLAFFLTEVIKLSLQEEAPDEHLFRFLYDSVLKLNDSDKVALKDFHLYFLYYFAKILGFEAPFLSTQTQSKQERMEKLSLFIDFYQENITNHKKIISQEVLKQILS